MFGETYQGRRVLVTGHTGFKGSWLTAWLTRLGAEVIGFSDAVPSRPSHFAALRSQTLLADLRGDVRDRQALQNALARFRPEIVFHLAAQALVRPSYDDPARTFEVNTLGTLNVLEAIRLSPSVRAAVCITSDKAYRNDEWVWGYRETDHLGGDDPYSASKGCAELVAHAYFTSFFRNGPRCATARAGNVIGGGDWAEDRIVPDCARAWAAGKPVELRSPGATRPWQHVLEPLSGYLHLASLLLRDDEGPLPIQGEAFNFGPPAEVNASVAEVVRELGVYWPGFTGVPAENAERNAKKECTLLKLCCDKALAVLRWRAVLTFAETLSLTAAWYRAYYEAATGNEDPDMSAVTGAQIDAYTALARERKLEWSLQ